MWMGANDVDFNDKRKKKKLEITEQFSFKWIAIVCNSANARWQCNNAHPFAHFFPLSLHVRFCAHFLDSFCSQLSCCQFTCRRRRRRRFFPISSVLGTTIRSFSANDYVWQTLALQKKKRTKPYRDNTNSLFLCNFNLFLGYMWGDICTLDK